MRTIYLADSGFQQINGNSKKPWYTPIEFSETPLPEFSYELKLNNDYPIKGKKFYPDRFEEGPDILAERMKPVRVRKGPKATGSKRTRHLPTVDEAAAFYGISPKHRSELDRILEEIEKDRE